MCRFHGEGYQEGYAEGCHVGAAEGRRYGSLHGAKMGSEVREKALYDRRVGCFFREKIAVAWKPLGEAHGHGEIQGCHSRVVQSSFCA